MLLLLIWWWCVVQIDNSQATYLSMKICSSLKILASSVWSSEMQALTSESWAMEHALTAQTCSLTVSTSILTDWNPKSQNHNYTASLQMPTKMMKKQDCVHESHGCKHFTWCSTGPCREQFFLKLSVCVNCLLYLLIQIGDCTVKIN